jgi:hypothetical protein
MLECAPSGGEPAAGDPGRYDREVLPADDAEIVAANGRPFDIERIDLETKRGTLEDNRLALSQPQNWVSSNRRGFLTKTGMAAATLGLGQVRELIGPTGS